MALLPFASLAYFLNRSLIIDTTHFIGGRWCSFYESFAVYANDVPTEYVTFLELQEEDFQHWNSFLKATNHVSHLYYNFGMRIYRQKHIYGLVRSLFGTDDELLAFYRKLLSVVWRLNHKIIEEVKNFRTENNLLDYFGVHIRWGDKYTQAKLLDVDYYIHKIEKLVEPNQEVKIFLMSDDEQSKHDLLHKRPKWKIFSLIPKNTHGNHQTSFTYSSVTFREENSHRLILELTLMAQAKYAFCTMSSNVCRLLQVLRTTEPSTLIPVDNMDWFPFK